MTNWTDSMYRENAISLDSMCVFHICTYLFTCIAYLFAFIYMCNESCNKQLQ